MSTGKQGRRWRSAWDSVTRTGSLQQKSRSSPVRKHPFMRPPTRLPRHWSLGTLPYGDSRLAAISLVVMLLVILVLGDPFGHPAYAQTADSSIDFAENRTVPVATFFAYDQDGDAIGWSLSGPDDDLFTIDDGVLAFREPPNYEDPQSATSGVSLAERNVYRVTVRAGGGTHDVAVRVTDVDEAGTASMDRRQPQVSRPLSASLSGRG